LRKVFAAAILSVLFSSSAEAFVFSFINSGVEWGWEGKRHFKFSQALEMCKVEDFDGATFTGVKGSAYFRWLKLGHNKININFSSGLGLALRYADFMDHFDDMTSFEPHLTALAIEPEFLFNERYSLFLRFPLLHYTYDFWPIYGPIRAGFISNIKIGISINFKGQRKNLSSEMRDK
jgi:hypothetical protein